MKRRQLLILPVFLCSACSFCILVYVQMCSNSTCFDIQTYSTKASHIAQDSILQYSTAALNSSQRCPGGGELVYEKFCAFRSWRSSGETDSHSAVVTLSTQGTVEYLHHVITLCNRWQGPISVAVYFSGQKEFAQVVRTIDTLRVCNPCVLRRIDWHLFYKESHPPSASKVFNSQVDCATISYEIIRPPGWKRNSSYPINVGRNIARNSAVTAYVFASDIELYPSENIPERFERLMRSRKNSSKREVYVLPVFEVYSNFEAPRTKERLRYMYHRKQAITFHKYRCNICHRIPNSSKWMNFTYAQPNDSKSNTTATAIRPFHIWTTVKRDSRYGLQFWEPFFIGTSRDPQFDPRLSWEGKQNKMQVAYEMCLMDYDFHILDEAFLVHSPGVNIYSSAKDRFRSPFMAENYKVMKTIKKSLLKKYGPKHKC